MHRRMSGVISSVCPVVILASCRPVQNTSLAERVEQAEQQWAAQAVEGYRVVVVTTGIWHMQSHEITVKDSRIVAGNATCEPSLLEFGECEVQPFEAETCTVPGLLAHTRGLAPSPEARYGRMDLHPTYGLPVGLSFDHPQMVDEGWSRRVEPFEVLEGRHKGKTCYWESRGRRSWGSDVNKVIE